MQIVVVITKTYNWKGCSNMGKKPAVIKPSIQPSPKILVSCRGLDGKDNALAVAYCCNCSYDPPMVMVGIVPSRHSYKMIKESGCFVVNLPGKENKELFDYLGSHSGRNEDKLLNARAKVSNGKKVNAPILDDCPINIECTVTGSILSGSHEMFVGKIEYIHAEPGLLNENEEIDFKSANLL
jgi:flavin reductase (DIM6/NTAB) family NADH-FMN oxidoreductase RutF